MTADRPAALAARIALRVAPGGRPLVALDHDGTLAPLAATPAAAMLAPGAAEALAALAPRAEIAVVSGRGLADLRARLGHLALTLVAEHGLRLVTRTGEETSLARPVGADALMRARAELAELLPADEGWLVEDKGVALAVHHRRVAAARVAARLPAVRVVLERAAAAGGGVLQVGHAVLEVRPEGADKGTALRWLASHHAARPVIMVGDDATDESALAAAEALAGIGVLVATEPRPSAASARLRDPQEVVAFLRALAAELPPVAD